MSQQSVLKKLNYIFKKKKKMKENMEAGNNPSLLNLYCEPTFKMGLIIFLYIAFFYSL